MKLAISGKGGVGKSTLAAAISLLVARRGRRVLAVDADPDANLASALGISQAESEEIVPVAERKSLIEQRTGAKVKQYGQIFKINPDVSDIAEICAIDRDGVSLIVLGAVAAGGGGCACPESVLLKALVTDLVLYKDEALVLDMEAGIEHLGRGTARGVDAMVVVVEPGKRSIDCATRIHRMAGEIGLENVVAVANKVVSEDDEKFVRDQLARVGIDIVGVIPFTQRIRLADRDGKSVLDAADENEITMFTDILTNIEQTITGA